MDTKQMILKHLEIIEGAEAQLRAMLNAAQPIGGSYFQDETVLASRPRCLERLQLISTSTWACRDLLEHQNETLGE